MSLHRVVMSLRVQTDSCSGSIRRFPKAIYSARGLRVRILLTVQVTATKNIKMRRIIFIVAMVAAVQARPGLLFAAPLHQVGIQYAQDSTPIVQPHPAVELNAASEGLLPRELLKSKDFYDNPSIAEGLAKESWFTNKEMQVVEREAEKIPRERIYQIVKNAGFLDNH